jgi:CelD/BcsL family acetyltransferase involved in cellulose biosynthesis
LENKHHRRKIKDFSKQGHLEYRSISDSNQIREWLPSFMDLHIEQWRTKEDPSIFNKEINRKYIYSLLDEMDLQNSLRMDLLLLDKELVAADFNFTWDNRIYGYLTCYSLKYFQYSPGTLLLGYMIRDASINNFNEIDFLLGRENYKEPLASYIRKTGIMIIFHSRLDWFYDFWGTSMMKIRRLLIQIRTKLSRNNTQSAKPVDNVI